VLLLSVQKIGMGREEEKIGVETNRREREGRIKGGRRAKNTEPTMRCHVHDSGTYLL